VFAFAITLGGVVYLFLCNGQLRGVYFLYRYFPVSVVVGWKFVAASLIVIPALRTSLTGASPSLVGWSLSLALAALNLAMFLRIGHHFKDLRRAAWPLQNVSKR
jgi:hypothetical protein